MASAMLIHTDGWSFAYGSYHYTMPDSALLARADISQRLQARISAAPAAMTLVGTAILQEVGRNATNG